MKSSDDPHVLSYGGLHMLALTKIAIALSCQRMWDGKAHSNNLSITLGKQCNEQNLDGDSAPMSVSPRSHSIIVCPACPVLCSGNGQYTKGACLCYSGWKGPECDVPISQCIDPACGGHGSCIEGNCVCSVGYKGENCEEGKCYNANYIFAACIE
ncbi:hypothetical protein lerEdw1_016420 [Lerista edwardsae]|nr:hypothetical protein lerEdw1_016420 [Lerista edwardsae]